MLAQEEFHHTALRSAVQAFPVNQRNKIYTAIRQFVVRHPAVAYAEREGFIVHEGLIAAARTVASFYRPLPSVVLFDGQARLCGHCGSTLWPDRDILSFPEGRCRIRQCRLAHPEPVRGADVESPSEWYLATPAALAFWVGPGLDDIRIHDALLAAGRRSVLYPFSDAADVGVDGYAIGIDVKVYASPVVLATKLTRTVGRLTQFRRGIISVPDDKLRLNPHYLEQLRYFYQGPHPIEFMTASQAIRALV